MYKRVLSTALAFTGVVVGAGFASGQEALQFFVAFGTWGIVGAVFASLLMVLVATAIMQLGSYYQAREHLAVLDRISHRIVAMILDGATIITLFSIGFVMFAGGGANLNQQFGLDTWVGATIILVLVLITGLFDVDRVSAIIGLITPLAVIFIIGATAYTLLTSDWNLSALDAASANVDTSLPSWWLSALNYTGLNVMTAVSMTIVIGGNLIDTKVAGYGGLLGGFFYLVMLILLTLALLLQVETVNGTDMPVLALINDIHPTLGLAMTFIVFGMIFNTAIGMFYALGKRLSRNHRERFMPIFVGTCLVGFAFSFVEFRVLVSNLYPALGYLGILMIIVLSYAWLRGGAKLRKEGRRRARALALMERRLDPNLRFTKGNARELEKLTSASNIEDELFTDSLEREVRGKLA